MNGWIILGGDGDHLPPHDYVGDHLGTLPSAHNYKPGQWVLWRPVAGVIAGTSTQMAVICANVPETGQQSFVITLPDELTLEQRQAFIALFGKGAE